MSKGSAPRPFEVDRNVYSNNWDAIFGKNKDVQNKPDDSQECAKKSENTDVELPKRAE